MQVTVKNIKKKKRSLRGKIKNSILKVFKQFKYSCKKKITTRPLHTKVFF